jgi:hypothetical protein
MYCLFLFYKSKDYQGILFWEREWRDATELKYEFALLLRLETECAKFIHEDH